MIICHTETKKKQYTHKKATKIQKTKKTINFERSYKNPIAEHRHAHAHTHNNFNICVYIFDLLTDIMKPQINK